MYVLPSKIFVPPCFLRFFAIVTVYKITRTIYISPILHLRDYSDFLHVKEKLCIEFSKIERELELRKPFSLIACR